MDSEQEKLFRAAYDRAFLEMVNRTDRERADEALRRAYEKKLQEMAGYVWPKTEV